MDKKLEIRDLAYILIYISIIFLGIAGTFIYLILGNLKISLFIFVNYLILFIFGILYYKKDIVEAKNNLKNYKKLILYIVFVGIGSVALSTIIEMIFSIGETNNQTIVNENILENPLLSFVSVVILGPLVEEIIYRHIFLGKLSNMISKGVAIVFSVIMFSSVHTGFSREILIYIPMAIGITIMYLKFNKNIIASYLYHSLWNLYAFIINYILLFKI